MERPSGEVIPSIERSTIPETITLDELKAVLVAANLPVETYGNGPAKTIEQLLKEIQEGEAVITIDNTGNLTRTISVLGIDVICVLSNGDVYKLKEDHQEFNTGYIKKRELTSSIGEKLKPGEILDEGVARALEEELDITETLSINYVDQEKKEFIPDTFPGLLSKYLIHKFICYIPESEYIPDGYIERQADKTNFYRWELIS